MIEERRPDDPIRLWVRDGPMVASSEFVERTRQVVASGRPLCPTCGEPVDEGHVCGAPAT